MRYKHTFDKANWIKVDRKVLNKYVNKGYWVAGITADRG
ncbi:MAG: hypothetical protein Pg6B_01230 [Candidatus Azobacteroides pseudotrichonymphae]|jgi:hypothetical protein|nr:MAG: hypothetical protein Pg6B_01230 [Candidatus Azobacteroides pseudotrichonymphae]